MFSKELSIGHFTINEASPIFLIAEAGVNHNGDLDMALKLVDAACEAGATAVKFQSFITENIITPYANKADYHIQTTGSDEDQSWMELLRWTPIGLAPKPRRRCEEGRKKQFLDRLTDDGGRRWGRRNQ